MVAVGFIGIHTGVTGLAVRISPLECRITIGIGFKGQRRTTQLTGTVFFAICSPFAIVFVLPTTARADELVGVGSLRKVLVASSDSRIAGGATLNTPFIEAKRAHGGTNIVLTRIGRAGFHFVGFRVVRFGFIIEVKLDGWPFGICGIGCVWIGKGWVTGSDVRIVWLPGGIQLH